MRIALVTVTILAVALSGCDKKDDMADLKDFVTQAKFAAKPKTQALPNLQLNKSVHYVSNGMKNPFIPLKSDVRKKVKQQNPLQNYPLESLHLVGVLAKKDKYWAAIMLPSGHILEVGVGAQVGQNRAEIKSISPEKVVLNEKVHTSKGDRVKEIQMAISRGN